MFKVHKTMKEIIEVENCKNYEVFHLVLTYMYTGKISLDKHTVADILEIAHGYAISKLKSYCSEFLEKYYLRPKDCLTAVELSVKYHLADLGKQALEFIHKHFKQVVKYHDIERMSLTKLQEYLNHSWWFPPELVLRIIIRWISHDQDRRAENFLQLFHNVVNEQSISSFVTNHLDRDEKEIYQVLQDRFLPDYQEIEQELEDNSSFLSIAFSAVKDLENQEVDETFSSYILQPEPLAEAQYGGYRQQGAGQGGLETGLLGMESSYPLATPTKQSHAPAKPGESHQSGSGAQGDTAAEKSLEPLESSQFLSSDTEDIKTPLRAVPDPGGAGSGGYLDPSSSMMFSGSKVMLTPHNSAASSPIPSSVPSPLNPGTRYREAGDQELCLDQGAVQVFPKPLVLSHAPNQAEYYKPGGQEHLYPPPPHPLPPPPPQPGPLYREERGLEYGGEMYRGYPGPALDTGYRGNHACIQSYDPYRLPEQDTAAMMQRPQDFGQNFREVGLIPEDKTFSSSDPQQSRLSLDFQIDDYPIIQQFINEEEERTKYSATKRYDPKHRALAQALRKKDLVQAAAAEGEHSCYPCKQQQPAQLEPCHGPKPEQLSFEQLQEAGPGPGSCKLEQEAVSPPTHAQCQYSGRPPPVSSPSPPPPPPASGGRAHLQAASSGEDPRPAAVAGPGAEAAADKETSSDTEPRSPAPSLQTAASSTQSSLQLASCVQDPLQTPEKSEYCSGHSEEADNKRSSKPEPQQLFLTPKEKYAKEVSAQNQAPHAVVSFGDLSQVNETDKPDQTLSESPSPSKPCPSYSHSTNKSIYPSALKILKSKKKMASQKRLILEHGEVRLTQRQRLRIRLKKTRRLRAKDIFQPTQVEEPPQTEEADSQNADDVAPKKIINRKDKLLAEHRAEAEHLNQAQLSEADRQKNTFKCDKCSFRCGTDKKLKVHEKVHKGDKQFVCPFCSFTSYWIKDHYQHIQVNCATNIFKAFFSEQCTISRQSTFPVVRRTSVLGVSTRTRG